MHKIIWAEGLLLSQHHLQYWEKYLLWQINQNASFDTCCGEGFSKLELNEDALQDDIFEIKNFECYLGKKWHILNCGSYRTSLSFELNQQPSPHALYLCTSKMHRIEGVPGYEASANNPGSVRYLKIEDDYDGYRTKEVLITNPHFYLKTTPPDIDSEHGLLVAKLFKIDEHWVLNNQYIPPILTLKVSDVLKTMLVGFLSKLTNKVQILRKYINDIEPNHDSNVNQIRISLNNIEVYIHKMKKNMQKGAHPESMFEITLEHLIACFSMIDDGSSEELPNYVHQNSYDGWFELLRQFHQAVAKLMPAGSTKVVLHKESDSFYLAKGLEKSSFVNSTILLRINLDTASRDWINEIVKKIKIGAKEDMGLILSSALSGIKIQHSIHISAKLPVKPGCEYFRLIPLGDFWNSASHSSSLAIFLPEEYKQAKLDIVLLSE